jgi:hypothetical protein
MQNLFATNAQSPPSNINFNTSSKVISTSPPVNSADLSKTNINSADFNTMQNMFATNNALFSVNMTGSNTSTIENKP